MAALLFEAFDAIVEVVGAVVIAEAEESGTTLLSVMTELANSASAGAAITDADESALFMADVRQFLNPDDDSLISAAAGRVSVSIDDYGIQTVRDILQKSLFQLFQSIEQGGNAAAAAAMEQTSAVVEEVGPVDALSNLVDTAGGTDPDALTPEQVESAEADRSQDADLLQQAADKDTVGMMDTVVNSPPPATSPGTWRFLVVQLAVSTVSKIIFIIFIVVMAVMAYFASKIANLLCRMFNPSDAKKVCTNQCTNFLKKLRKWLIAHSYLVLGAPVVVAGAYAFASSAYATSILLFVILEAIACLLLSKVGFAVANIGCDVEGVWNFLTTGKISPSG